MALTYQEFKDYLVTYLWRTGDSVLIANLDNLIRMADAELMRTLEIEDRHKSVTLGVASTRVTLPTDFRTIRGVADLDTQLGEFKYVTPSRINELRSLLQNSEWLPVYSIEGNDLLLTGPVEDSRQTTGPNPPASPSEGHLWYRTGASAGLYVWHVDPTSSQWVQLSGETAVAADASTQAIFLVVDYFQRIPDYKVDDASWVEDEYLDLYTYAVLKQSASFLREDERVQLWQGLFTTALDQANAESAWSRARGVPKGHGLPRQAGIIRRGRGHGRVG